MRHLRLHLSRRGGWNAGKPGHCAVWAYPSLWGALWGAWRLHRSRCRQRKEDRPGQLPPGYGYGWDKWLTGCGSEDVRPPGDRRRALDGRAGSAGEEGSYGAWRIGYMDVGG